MIDMQLIENGILTGGVLFTLAIFSWSLYFFLQDVYQQNIHWQHVLSITFALFVSWVAMIILTIIGTVVYVLIDLIGIV